MRAGRAEVKVGRLIVGFFGSGKDLKLCKARSTEYEAVQADCKHLYDGD